MEGMQLLNAWMAALWTETDGQDLVEYSLLLGFIALAAVSILTGVKSSMTTIFSKIASCLTSAVAAS